MGTWYTTREDVMSAQDIKATAYSGPQIDRAIEAGARAADALLHRDFSPWTGTRYYDYPGDQMVRAWRIWLGRYSLITLTAITINNGTTVATGSVFLDPQDGPPYDRIEVDQSTTSAFSAGTTWQRAIGITGLWGYTDDEASAGTIAEDLDALETEVDGSTMPTVGVGSVLRVGSERMAVTDRTWLTTGQTGTLAAQNSAQALTVADGTAFAAGETLLIDSERVRVVDVAANVLTVKRAADGSTLAAHAAGTIYAPRALTVTRGALGTTAATHTTGATAYEWQPPGPLSALNRAYAINTLLQEQTGYARTAGSGDSEREMTGRAIRDIEATAMLALGRQARTAVV